MAAIFGRSEWEANGNFEMAGARATYAKLQAAHHDVSRFHIEQGWFSDQVIADLGVCSVFYANTHSSVERFETDMAYDWVYSTSAHGNPNVLTTRTTAMGSRTPPFNSNGNPPITIALLDSCFAGNSSDFGHGFLYPEQNAFGPPLENQAYVGWIWATSEFVAFDCAAAFWGHLADGGSVYLARYWMVQAWAAHYGLDVYDPALFVRIHGDQHTRLASVYDGFDILKPISAWWRTIQ